MTMRMRDLSERSGLPKTTIHHYVREGLLPAARKSAPNVAEYGDEHLDRLDLISQLRGDSMGPLSIPDIRRVLAWIDDGMDPRAAARLVTAGVDVSDGTGRTVSGPAVAEKAGISPEAAAVLEASGLIEAPLSDGYSPGDLLVARAYGRLWSVSAGEIDPADLMPLADLAREIGSYSATLAELHAARSAARPGAPGVDGTDELRRRLATLCEALLWRALA